MRWRGRIPGVSTASGQVSSVSRTGAVTTSSVDAGSEASILNRNKTSRALKYKYTGKISDCLLLRDGRLRVSKEEHV
jgi:hypothetical protein